MSNDTKEPRLSDPVKPDDPATTDPTQPLSRTLTSILERITAIEDKLKGWVSGVATVFGDWKSATIVPPEEVFERYSTELEATQQKRTAHGTNVFLTIWKSRGRFFHSLDTEGGNKHVHRAGAQFRGAGSKHDGFYLGEQLREVTHADGSTELQRILYVANGKVADPHHPNFEGDQNIRIVAVTSVAKDGVFVINDTDARRALS